LTEWRPIEDFPDYLVNEYGDIKNEYRDRLLTQRLNREDFMMTGLVRDQRQYTRAVAPIVARAFLGHPPSDAYNSVIHLNGDRVDCRALNLMWRPRWYAIRYHHMFFEAPLRISVYVPAIRRRFYSLREFCTTYGLVEALTYLNLTNGEPCFHYRWYLERSEDE
jgi:hypothetical protein